MPRSITPPERRRIQEPAPRRNTSTRRIIKDCCGVNTTENAAALVAAAGERSGLSGDDAMALAVEETRAERRR